MKQALSRVLPGVPYVTIITDIADYPPRFWIERHDQGLHKGQYKEKKEKKRKGEHDSSGKH